MSNSIFRFGQELPAYDVSVLNERALRASAGMLFFSGDRVVDERMAAGQLSAYTGVRGRVSRGLHDSHLH